MRETEQIAFEFHGAVPGLKGEGSAPHEPEVCLEKRRIEVVGDAASSQHPLRLNPQALDGQDLFFAETKPGSVDPVSAAEETRFRGGFHGFVPGEDLLGNGHSLVERRNRGQEVVGAEIFALKHPAATHDVAIYRVSGSVKAATDLW